MEQEVADQEESTEDLPQPQRQPTFIERVSKGSSKQWSKLRSRAKAIGTFLKLRKESVIARPQSPELVTEQEAPAVDPLSLAGQQGKAGILREIFRENRLVWRLDRCGIEEQISQNFQNAVRQGASCFEFLDFDYSKLEDAAESTAPLSTQDRYVRCYVSAAYADMQAERRLLAQEVFPTLRQRCLQLGIHFQEVDFCWGVTQQKAERKATVMQRILELRQNVRTYVIGIVGERYGFTYVLDSSLSSASIDPLFKAKKAAVVGLSEIEMDEGPLSSTIPHMGFYYFRDPKYLNQITDKQERHMLQSESLLARERLSHMKAKLRMSPVAIVENYQSPEEFANQVIQDLSQQIAQDFPEDIDAETIANVDKHIVYDYEQRTLEDYTGREDDMDLLDERVLGVQSFELPTVVTGEPGVGKSAFLVAWSRRFETRQNIDFFFKHYAGLHSEGGSWAAIVNGILDGLKKSFGLRKDVPNEIRVLPGAFALWTNNLSSLSARCILMIDAVDAVHEILYESKMQIKKYDEEEEVEDEEDEDEDEDEDGSEAKEIQDENLTENVHKGKEDAGIAQTMHWLPTGFPSNVRMVVSCSEGSAALAQLKRRRWNLLRLGPIADDNRKDILERLLKARGVAMPEALEERLCERKRTLNPLFLVQILRAVKEPADMKPSGVVAAAILCRNLAELLTTMVVRLENKPGVQERHGLVEEALCALALSRRGLSEAELLGILQVPRALFTLFYLESRPLFKLQFGLLSLSCMTLHSLVLDRYLQDQDTRIDVRLRIADFFRNRLMSHRAIEEAPWQLLQCHRWSDLSAYIMRPDPFLLLSSTSMGLFDLVVYWDYLASPDWGGLSLVDKCEECARMAAEFQLVPASEVDLMNRLSDLLQRMQHFDSAVGFMRRARAIEERYFGMSILNSFDYSIREARIQRDRGDYIGARRAYQRIVEQLTAIVDTDGDGELSYEEMKATEAGTVLLETEEELMHLLWQGGFWLQLEDQCVQMLERDEGRPTNELLLFDMIIHSHLERGKYDSAQEFGHRAVAAVADHQSMEYNHVLHRTVGLLLMLQQYQKVVAIMEVELQERGMEVKRDMEIQASDVDMLGMYSLALCRVGRTEEAVLILDTAVHTLHREESDLPSLVTPLPAPDTRHALIGSDDESSEAGSREAASEAEEEDRRTGVIITDIMVLGLAGMAHRERSSWQSAEELYQRAVGLGVLSFGATDPSVSFVVGEIAALYEARREQTKALDMRRTAVAMLRASLGPSLLLYRAILALAGSHWKFGEYAKAEALATQVVYGVENRFGSRHEILPRALTLLGMALMSQGKLQQAQELLQRAQRLGSALFGGQHSDAIDAAFAAAQAEELRGEYRRAEMGLLEVLQSRTAVWGSDHAGVQQVLVAMALLYFRIDAYAEVEELLWRALPGIQQCHGPDSVPVACVLSFLALVHTQLGTSVNGHVSDIVALLLRALRIRVSIMGPVSIAAVQHSIYTGLILVHLKQLARAEPLLRQAYLDLQTSSHPPAGTLPLRKLVYAHLQRCNEALPPESRPPLPPWSDDLEPVAEPVEGEEVSGAAATVASLLGIPAEGLRTNDVEGPPAVDDNAPASASEDEPPAEGERSPDNNTTDEAEGDEGQGMSADEPAESFIAGEAARPQSAPRSSRGGDGAAAQGAAHRPSSAAPSGGSGSSRRLREDAAVRTLQPFTPVRVEDGRSASDEEEERRPAAGSARGSGPEPLERRRSRRVLTNVDAKDEEGNTALHQAVRDGDAGAVRSLLEGRASPTAQNRGGEAPLHLAAASGHLGILRSLVEGMGGATVDLPGPQDKTALHLAVEAGAVSVVQFLVSECGADPLAAAADAATPLSVATAQAGAGAAAEAEASARILRALEDARNQTIAP